MKRCEQARGAHAPHVGLETFEASACNWAAPYHEPKHIAAPTDVSCQPTVSNLDTSRKYCLILGAKEPAYCEGLRKQKSDYVGVNESEIFWGRPFGTRLQVHQFASQCRLTLTCGLLYSTLLHPMPPSPDYDHTTTVS